MLVFAGLGNPGEKYVDTRHNSGYFFADSLRDFLGWSGTYDVSDWQEDKSLEASVCYCRLGQELKISLVKPHTYMNASGRAIQKFCNLHKIDVSNEFILAHDDLDIELGKYKIQREKSPKEHNGVNNVELMLGRKDFLRVRLGVDNRDPQKRINGESYVLLKMKAQEIQLLSNSISEAIKNVRNMLYI